MNGQGSRRAPVEAWDSCIGPAGGGGAPFRSASGDGSPDTQESRPSRHHDATEGVFVLNSRASFSGMGLRRWRRGRREKPYPASLRLSLWRIALRGVGQAARASPLSLHHLPGIQPAAVRRRDAFWAGSITLRVGHQIEFKRYRPPPAARRGHCRSCSAPVVEFLRLAPFVQLAFVPSKLFPDQGALPPPALHIFYHRRLGDIADDLPKVSGYWASELAVMKRVLASIADA